MCDIQHDEIERLVKLRGEFRECAATFQRRADQYGVGGRNDGVMASVWANASRMVEARIIEALGGAVPSQGGGE